MIESEQSQKFLIPHNTSEKNKFKSRKREVSYPNKGMNHDNELYKLQKITLQRNKTKLRLQKYCRGTGETLNSTSLSYLRLDHD